MYPYVSARRRAVAWGSVALTALVCSAAIAQEDNAGADARNVVWLLVLPAILLAGGALQAVVAVLFPRWTRAARLAISTRRGLCLGWGAAIAVFAFVVLLIGSALQGVVAFLAAVIVLLTLLLCVAGYVGIAAAMGEHLAEGSSYAGDRTPLQALAGGVTLCFACLTPILGQILFLLLLMASVGAAVVGLCLRSSVAEQGSPEEAA
jgi:hypothetical protein